MKNKKPLTPEMLLKPKYIKVRNVKPTKKNIRAGLLIPVGSLP